MPKMTAALELDTVSPTEPAAAVPTVDPPTEPLAETIARLRDEARRDPEGYLARTVVPEGGE